MKVLILGGFLGSGKTTVLLQLARYLTDHTDSDSQYRVLIVENEVGETGVDDQYLRGEGLAVETLFAGCACCSLSGDLVRMFQRLRKEYDPEWIVLEATGIAMPENIRIVLKASMQLESHSVVLVDANRWKRIRIPLHDLLWDQISGADTILINKSDLVDDNTLNEIEKEIHSINEKADVFRICALHPIQEDLWEHIIKQGADQYDT